MRKIYFWYGVFFRMSGENMRIEGRNNLIKGLKKELIISFYFDMKVINGYKGSV